MSVPIATFALPVLVMMALWWSRWPTDRMSRPASLAINTLALAAAGFLLTVAGQAVVGKVDLAVERGGPPQGRAASPRGSRPPGSRKPSVPAQRELPELLPS